MMQKPISNGGPLIAGGVELDREKRRVRCAGRQVAVAPTEFRLLEVLMQTPGRVFSREQLVEAIWGPGASVDARTVDVNISRLRKSLTTRHGPDAVRTVRGAGYSFL
jgi:two-component system phosphate regulon response regulator PhoB